MDSALQLEMNVQQYNLQVLAMLHTLGITPSSATYSRNKHISLTQWYVGHITCDALVWLPRVVTNYKLAVTCVYKLEAIQAKLVI